MAGGAVWLAEFWDRRQQRYPSGKDPFLGRAPPASWEGAARWAQSLASWAGRRGGDRAHSQGRL